jgi:hypothetical protein
MEDIERTQINALLSGQREKNDEDLELGRQVHARAKRILDPLPVTHDTQILWGSDDDRMVQIKRKRIIYTSENGAQEIALTNFHKNKSSNGVIAVELPDQKGHYSHDPDYAFAVHPDGTVISPLGLVNPELANAMLELFEEVPKVGSVKST